MPALTQTVFFSNIPDMDAQFVLDLCQSMVFTGLLVSLPILIAGTVIGLAVGLLQALTQIQEQTIGIVLKIVVMVLVAAYTIPWMTDIMVERATDVFQTIPRVIPYD